MFLFARHALGLYAAACLLLTGLWLAVTGRPGILTMFATLDFSGKGHRTNLPVGCWPITLVGDLATAPLQLPLLLPFTVDWLRRTHRSFRVRAALRSPQTLQGLIDKVGVAGLAEWEYEAIEKTCQLAGLIAPQDIAKLIDLFSSEDYPGYGESPLVGLMTKQEISADDRHRIFIAQTRRDQYDRHIRVLEALASSRDTPMELLQALRVLDGPGDHARYAGHTIDDLLGRK
jgi:hypothetical protein